MEKRDLYSRMIQPILGNNLSFSADNRTIDKETGDYKDPLMRWPLRGAAFTNEVGEAMRPLIGSYANLTWIPVLMYIGADVYDKYKNDQTEYSPNSRRCLKQAVFQGLASVFLPVLAVKAGQNIFSKLGLLTNEKISLNAKKHISDMAETFIANGKMRAYQGRDDECRREFLAQVVDNIEFKEKKNRFKNTFRFFRLDKNFNIEKYAEKTICDLIQLRKDLLAPTEEMKNNKWYGEYVAALKSGQTKNVATKSVLTHFQKNKLTTGNFVKTIGGFMALAFSIKPIDDFVENILIEKYVGPGIDNLAKNK